MSKKRFLMPSQRQLTYNRFNVDDFEKRFRNGGADALKTLYWNYERGRFQWEGGENCVVAFDEREFFGEYTELLVDGLDTAEVEAELERVCSNIRERREREKHPKYARDFGEETPDIRRRLSVSVADLMRSLGVRFSAYSLYEKLGEKNLIDENVFDIQNPNCRFRFGGCFGYKFNRAVYETILKNVLGIEVAVRGAFNDVRFDTATVEAFAEALRNRIDIERNDAEAWFCFDYIDGQYIEYSDRSGVFRFYVEKTFRVDDYKYKTSALV